ncbi:hypothetical protein [Nocardia niwae]|uniref:hypothetical protein n=1 Tax=Nocardia niwae TaxID=626084 RepID=UPI0033CD63A5
MEHKVATADVAEKFNKRFAGLLETVSLSRAEIIRRVFIGTSLLRIAAEDGVSLLEVRGQFNAALSQLRHPSRAAGLRTHELDEDDFTQIVRQLTKNAESEELPLVWCEHHGWTDPQGRTQCPECNCELTTSANDDAISGVEFGRPRRYCSNACRQRAYRRRRKAAAEVGLVDDQ